MSTHFALPIIRRFATLALAPVAAVWMFCAPANAQMPQVQGEALLTPKTAAERQQEQREQLHKEIAAERAEIVSKRVVIEQQRVADDKLCYQKFSVESCLADAREQARIKDAPLRARELQINELERRQAAAARLQSIEEKKAEKSAVPMKSQKREGADKRQPTPTGVGAKPAVDEQAAQALRHSEAQQRASKQAEYQRSHELSRAKADQGRAEREAKARAEREAKLKEAAERKARSLQQAKERGQTAAPLPAPAP
ncbi:hypothetical protein KUF54_07925 [Comamonas sp. Y33R10-2]|nr:hypothetical protein KUF54_07925 [Comamonas sp. Y33R10-2]